MTDTDTSRMRDVDHTHPHGGDATRRLYERGNEGTGPSSADETDDDE